MIRDTSAASRKFNGTTTTSLKTRDYQVSEDFTLTAIARSISSGATSGSVVVQDVILNSIGTGSVSGYNDYSVGIPLSASSGVYSSSNTSIARINSNGIVTPLSAGSTNILYSIPNFSTRGLTLTVTVSSSTTQSFSSRASGSLGENSDNSVSGYIYNIIPPTIPSDYNSLPIAYNQYYNIYTNSSRQTRNTNLWCNAVSGITAIGHLSTSYGCALITARDIIVAQHLWGGITTPSTYTYPDTANWTVYFHGRNNVLASGTPYKITRIGSTDIAVVTFVSDISSDIDRFKILPSGFRNYLPQPSYGYSCMYRTQDEVMSIGDMILYPTNDIFTFRRSTDPYRTNWWQTPRGGDSSSPIMMIINNEAVLLSTFQFGYGDGGGPILSDYINQINTAISGNGSPYQIRTTRVLSGDGLVIALSGFNSY